MTLAARIAKLPRPLDTIVAWALYGSVLFVSIGFNIITLGNPLLMTTSAKSYLYARDEWRSKRQRDYWAGWERWIDAKFKRLDGPNHCERAAKDLKAGTVWSLRRFM